MRLIDNKQGRILGNELTKRIEENSVLSLSTGFFSIYALYFLREQLKNVKDINILLLANPITNTPEGISITTESVIWGCDEEKEVKRQDRKSVV